MYLKTSVASPRVSRPSVGSSTNGSFPERSRRRSFIISTQDEVYPAYFPLAEYLIDLHDLDGLWKCESKGISAFAIYHVQPLPSNHIRNLSALYGVLDGWNRNPQVLCCLFYDNALGEEASIRKRNSVRSTHCSGEENRLQSSGGRNGERGRRSASRQARPTNGVVVDDDPS